MKNTPFIWFKVLNLKKWLKRENFFGQLRPLLSIFTVGNQMLRFQVWLIKVIKTWLKLIKTMTCLFHLWMLSVPKHHHPDPYLRSDKNFSTKNFFRQIKITTKNNSKFSREYQIEEKHWSLLSFKKNNKNDEMVAVCNFCLHLAFIPQICQLWHN